MLISVIIPTCNRKILLTNCLDRLHQNIQTSGDFLYEVIVSDDSLDDFTKRLLNEKYQWVNWTQGPRKGSAANRNNGAKYAKGEWLIFLDDDCLPQNQWLKSYINIISICKESVLEGKTIADRSQNRFDEESPINTEGNRLWSCNFAIKKSLFQQLEGFDEMFPYTAMEDTDLYTRINKITSVLFVPDAIVVHPWRRIKLFRNIKKHLKSHIYFAKKHGFYYSWRYRWSRFKVFLGSIYYDFKHLIQYSMKGWPYYIEKSILNLLLIFS